MPLEIHTIDLSASLGEWTLSVATPGEPLRRFVNELWEVRGQTAPFREALLPNGCVEVMINLGRPHRVLEGAGAGEWKDAWYSGLQERAIQIETLEGTHLLSARLHPLGAAALLGQDVARAANSILPLDAVIGEKAHELRERTMGAAAREQQFEILEEFLIRRLEGAEAVPDFVWRAAEMLESSHGALRIADLHESLGVSRKHLSVSFARYMGMPPKRYALVQRFLWTLDRIREDETVDWSTLAADAGYSDQSHLARDFSRIGAASPEEYLRRALPGTTALLHDEAPR